MGLLPPIDSEQPTSADRSPYTVALLDVVMRFSTSPNRQTILTGFLEYRAALHNMGITDGFQWLDGSFLEDVETLERRPPVDIDVVTFLRSPAGFVPTPEQVAILDHDSAKQQFHVDSFFVEIDKLPPETVVSQSAYWYSMWSHRRNQAWKGYLQVDLAPDQDQQAREWLQQLVAMEVMQA